MSKNKFYTFVSIFGFSVSLMFVILLSLYTKQELSVDNFHEKKDRIYLMTHEHGPNFGNTVAPFVEDNCPEVEAYCRVYVEHVLVTGKKEESFRAECLFADSTFFNMFSFKLTEGNPSQVLASQKSVIVTQRFANKVFGEENPVGKTLSIDDWEHTITGIMEEIPQNSQFRKCDFVASYSTIVNPVYFGGDWVLNTSDNFGFPIFLLKKERADLHAKIPYILELFKKEFFYYENGFAEKLDFIPLEDVYFKVKGWHFFKTNSINLIKIYITIAILILVIATLNYINMTVAQAGFRGKEAAIRKLLGGKKKSIISQLLGESLILTFITFGLGLFLSCIFEPFFNEALLTDVELIKQFTISNIVVATLFILLVAFVSGLIPALVISGFKPLEVVKGAFSRKVKTTYSKVLIIFQYIVAIVLLSCSFFIKQQSDFMIDYDLGYNRDAILSMPIRIEPSQKQGLKDKIRSIAGVEKVSYSQGTPMNVGNNFSFEKDGEPFSTQELKIDEDFLDIYGIKIDPSDAPFTDNSLFINDALLNSRLTNKQEMIIDLGFHGKILITGAVRDFHLGSLHGNNYKYIRVRKLPDDWGPWDISIKINEATDMFAVADKIQKEYRAYTGNEILDPPMFTDDIIQTWYKKEKNQLKILSAFTLLTIIISIMGVFAMSMYMIKQKEKEIGVRKVYGARENQILLMLNKASLLRVLIAFIIACPIAYYAITWWLEDFPYRISINWWTFALAGGIITILNLMSVSYMTWKAARANPVDTLKSE